MSPSDLSIYDTRIFVPSSQISMAKSPLRPSPARPLRVAGFWPGLLLLCLLAPVALAKSSLRPITDIEVREKKQACYADIESGLWGSRCRWPIIDKENCALRCLSPVCFQLIYESDPLEEGENDFVRGQEFKYCMRKVSLGESLDGIRGAFDYI